MSDKQKNNLPNGSDEQKASKVKKHLQCGSCTYLIRDRVFEAKCSELGRIPTSKACGSHVPDVFTLVNSEESLHNLQSLGDMMAQMGNNDLQILGALLLREKQTRKHGFKFHQKVYVRFRGTSNNNYLSNFVIGYVLDATKETIRVVGESGSTAITAINDKNSDSIYTAERFNPLRIAMVRDKRYVDPSLVDEDERLRKKMYASVMPLDQAVEEGILNKKTMANKAVKDDLVSLVARLGRGQLRREKKERVAPTGDEEVRIDWQR